MPFFPAESSDASVPLLNSASPWASTLEDLERLWDCPHTQAVTTRTATLAGYPDDPTKHQVRYNPYRTRDEAYLLRLSGRFLRFSIFDQLLRILTISARAILEVAKGDHEGGSVREKSDCFGWRFDGD